MNLARLVREHAARTPQRIAIIERGERLDYAGLWQRIGRMAAALAANGIRRGDVVGLAMADHTSHVVAHYAVACLGAVILPIDHRWTATERQRAATAFRATCVLSDGPACDGVTTLSAANGALESGRDEAPCDSSDGDLLISLSSGTTGRPTGGIVTHNNLHARFRAQWQAIGYGAADTFAVVTPLYFGAGRSFAMSILAAGGTLKLAPPPMKPDELVAALQADGVTASFLPPTLLRRLLPLHADGDAPLLGHLRYLLVSGEPLFADEARDCLEKICANLFSYYASTEGGGISLLKPGDFDANADTVGRPMPDTDVEIVDAAGAALPDGEVGRLRYRGPAVSSRQVDADGIERDLDDGGWYYPGDLAERRPGGFIALRGRDKDVIIRGGVNIYPAEIENVLQAHPEVHEAAVVGRKDGARGEIVAAYVAGGAIDTEALYAWCRERLAPYKLPQELVVVDALPRATSGKVDRRKLDLLS